MKLLRSFATVLATAVVAGPAFAQVEIRLSGAVAFRDTSYYAIRDLFGANLTSQNPVDSAAAQPPSRSSGPASSPGPSATNHHHPRLLQRRRRRHPGPDPEPQRQLPGVRQSRRHQHGQPPVGHRLLVGVPAVHRVPDAEAGRRPLGATPIVLLKSKTRLRQA